MQKRVDESDTLPCDAECRNVIFSFAAKRWLVQQIEEKFNYLFIYFIGLKNHE